MKRKPTYKDLEERIKTLRKRLDDLGYQGEQPGLANGNIPGLPVKDKIEAVSQKLLMEERLRQQLEREKIVSSISRRFIDNICDDHDQDFVFPLGTIGGFTGDDYCHFVMFSDNGRDNEQYAFEWCTGDCKPLLDLHQGRAFECYPWLRDKLNKNESIHALKLSDLPPEAENEKRVWQEHDVCSLLFIPLTSDGRVFGYLSLISKEPEKTWSKDIIGTLKLLGGIMQKAFSARRVMSALKNSEQLLRTIINSTPDRIFIKDRDFCFLFSNKSHSSPHGLRPDNIVGKNNYDLGFPEEQIIGNLDKGIRGFLTDDKEVLAGKSIHNPFDPVTDSDGSVKIFDTYKLPFYDDEKNIIGILGFARDITDRHEALEEKTRHLNETNIALKILLQQREKDKEKMEENILSNVKILIDPYIEKIKNTRLKPDQELIVELLESNLKNIISQFVVKLSSKYFNCTPMEIKVASLVKEGKTNQEIADILFVSKGTIITHRANIRRKLGLRKSKLNLRAYLLTMQ